ncbi:MAG: hypothetical protein LJE93_05260 [Acidobacteria bacterium]|jgi:hypothetical protein|nr:hypothetical protein [Acidobacteriota bacterium]
MNAAEGQILHQWSARKIHPVVMVYVVAVFLVFMALSRFVFHSPAAVKALAVAAFGAIVAMIPSALGRLEYRFTPSGLERRPLDRKKPRDFEEVFRWQELSHTISLKHGFKYYLRMEDTGPVRRFWRTHISDEYSGEFHVETDDRETVAEILERHKSPASPT